MVHPEDVNDALDQARAAAQDALDVAAQNPVTGALVPTRDGGAVEARALLAERKAAIVQARNAAVEAQARAKAAIETQRAELDRQMRAMDAMLAPLRDQIALLDEGVWTIGLYLGRSEEIHTLATGAPAPEGTPIHVRQQVLAMDEESAVHAERGGMDVTSIEEFDQWLTSDPKHLTQVLPELRGVVAIMPRRTDRDYGDPWLTDDINKRNHQTWWLIRNGENVYRMLTDFHVGRRLVPARDEFTSLFVDQHTNRPLEPGSHAWLKAEKAAGARERHYMRIALILQGLIDRTAVFHPLPVPGLSLLAPEHYDAGHVVLIADDENQLTTGRKPFYEWLAEKNRQLTPGMRVIINTGHAGWPDYTGPKFREPTHPRLTPGAAEAPSSTQVHTLTKRTPRGGLSFTYKRTEPKFVGGWGSTEFRAPKTPASCVIYPSDRFVLPIDLVTVAEMRTYLESRVERSAYADMFPTLNAAIAFKEAEAAQEAPFRTMLAGMIAQSDATSVEEAMTVVDDLVSWWKIGNRWHRPLNGAPQAEARATKAILAEHNARRRAADTSGAAAQILSALRSQHPNALFIARKKDGTWVVGMASPRKWAQPTDKAANPHGTQVAPLDVFIDLAEFTPTGKPRRVKTWQVPEPSVVSRWTMIDSSDAYDRWNRRARRAEHLSDPEIDAALAWLLAQPAPAGHQVIAISYEEGTGHREQPEFKVWYQPLAAPTFPGAPLTGSLPDVTTRVECYRWIRQDGAVRLGQPSWGASERKEWSAQHNTLIEPHRVGHVPPPWAGTHARLMVHLDEALLSTALRHAELWDEMRRRVAALTEQAQALFNGLRESYTERATDAAKAAFMAEYGNEFLWQDHSKTLSLKVPFSWWGGRDPGQAGASSATLRYLVERLVELGQHPYGLTVAQALARLTDLGQARDIPDGIEDLMGLRFPDLPAAKGLLDASPTTGDASR